MQLSLFFLGYYKILKFCVGIVSLFSYLGLNWTCWLNSIESYGLITETLFQSAGKRWWLAKVLQDSGKQNHEIHGFFCEFSQCIKSTWSLCNRLGASISRRNISQVAINILTVQPTRFLSFNIIFQFQTVTIKVAKSVICMIASSFTAIKIVKIVINFTIE